MRRVRSTLLVILALLLVWLVQLTGAKAQPTVTLTATPTTKATIQIPSASVLTAQTAPVAILPAQTGYVYVLVWAELTLNFKSAAYSSTACGLYYHGTTQLATGANLNSTVDGSASAVAIVPGVSAANVAVANIGSLGVDFACTTGNPTTGDSALKLVLEYVAVPL